MRIEEVLQGLDAHYDVEGWWPSASAWEVMVGAILTQQTTWTNVMRSLEGLKAKGLDGPCEVAAADIGELMDIVRPCGFFRQKSERLQGLAERICGDYSGDPMQLLSSDDARGRLLAIKGVGPETADSILVFAARRPYFVAAAYPERVLGRTGAVRVKGYHALQEEVHRSLGRDASTLARFYSLLVEHAKRHCRPKPSCQGCPLENGCLFISTERADSPGL